MLKIYLAFAVSSLFILATGLIPGIQIIHPDLMLINAFFLALSVFIHRVNGALQSRFPGSGPMLFLGLTFFRMLVSLVALGTYVIVNQQTRYNGLLLGLEFFLLYLVYAFVEIKSFMANLRRGSKDQSKL